MIESKKEQLGDLKEKLGVIKKKFSKFEEIHTKWLYFDHLSKTVELNAASNHLST